MKNNRTQVKININNLNLFIILDENYIYGIHWNKQEVKLSRRSNLDKAKLNLLSALETELLEFFTRGLKVFKTPIALEGTQFQLKVWKVLQSIPYGKTMSYKELALKLNSPNSSRAVGGANSKNPISIIIPCHRVIRANGDIGGYAGGVSVKKKILAIELGKT